jgi:hypothetical protein
MVIGVDTACPLCGTKYRTCVIGGPCPSCESAKLTEQEAYYPCPGCQDNGMRQEWCPVGGWTWAFCACAAGREEEEEQYRFYHTEN